MRAKIIRRDYQLERTQELNARASLGVTVVPPSIQSAKKFSLVGAVLEEVTFIPIYEDIPSGDVEFLSSKIPSEFDCTYEDPLTNNIASPIIEFLTNDGCELEFIEQVEFAENVVDLGYSHLLIPYELPVEPAHPKFDTSELTSLPDINAPTVDSNIQEIPATELPCKIHNFEQVVPTDGTICEDVFKDSGVTQLVVTDNGDIEQDIRQFQNNPVFVDVDDICFPYDQVSEIFLCIPEQYSSKVNSIEDTMVFTRLKLENFPSRALDLANSYSPSEAPLRDESIFFHKPISERVKSETTEDLTYLDPGVTLLPSVELRAEKLEAINYVWKALKIFIAHPFITSQYDFALPPLWGSESSSRKELFTVPYRPPTESNEELERSYAEKFELEFIHFKVLDSQVPWYLLPSPAIGHGLHHSGVSSYSTSKSDLRDSAQEQPLAETLHLVIDIPKDRLSQYYETVEKLTSFEDFERKPDTLHSTVRNIAAQLDEVVKPQASISDQLAQFMTSSGQGLSVATNIPTIALPPSASIFEFQTELAELALNKNTLLVLPPNVSPIPITAVVIYSYLACCKRVLWISQNQNAQAIDYHTNFLKDSSFNVMVLDSTSTMEALQAGHLVFADARWVDEKLHVNKRAFSEFGLTIFDPVRIGGEQNIQCRKIAKVLHASFKEQNLLVLSSNPPNEPRILREVSYDYSLEQILCKASSDQDMQEYVNARLLINVEISAPLRRIISRIADMGQQIIRNLIEKGILSESENWASLTVEYIKLLIGDANRRSMEMGDNDKMTNRMLVFELGKLILLRDLSCRIANSGISLGANLLLDRSKNPKLNSIIEPGLVEMLDQAMAEVEAGLYSEHPKVEVLHEIIDSEQAATNKTHSDQTRKKIMVIVKHEVVAMKLVKSIISSNVRATEVLRAKEEDFSLSVKNTLVSFDCLVILASHLSDFSGWGSFSVIVDYEQDTISSHPIILQFGDATTIKYVKLVSLDPSQRRNTGDGFTNDWITTIREYAQSSQKSANKGVVSVNKILESGGWPSWLFQTLNKSLSVAAVPFNSHASAALPGSKEQTPFVIVASEDFLQNQELVRQLEKDHHVFLEEAQLFDGEDLILDYKSCCLIFSSKEIPCTTPNLEQELVDKIFALTTLYERIWILFQILPNIDKNYCTQVQYLHELLLFARSKVTIVLSVSVKYSAKILRSICDRAAAMSTEEQGLTSLWDDRKWLSSFPSPEFVAHCHFPGGMNIFAAGLLLSRMSLLELVSTSLPKLKKAFSNVLPTQFIEKFYECTHFGNNMVQQVENELAAEDIPLLRETFKFSRVKSKTAPNDFNTEYMEHTRETPTFTRGGTTKKSLQAFISNKMHAAPDVPDERPVESSTKSGPTRKRQLHDDKDEFVAQQPIAKKITLDPHIPKTKQAKSPLKPIKYIEQFRFQGENERVYTADRAPSLSSTEDFAKFASQKEYKRDLEVDRKAKRFKPAEYIWNSSKETLKHPPDPYETFQTPKQAKKLHGSRRAETLLCNNKKATLEHPPFPEEIFGSSRKTELLPRGNDNHSKHKSGRTSSYDNKRDFEERRDYNKSSYTDKRNYGDNQFYKDERDDTNYGGQRENNEKRSYSNMRNYGDIKSYREKQNYGNTRNYGEKKTTYKDNMEEMRTFGEKRTYIDELKDRTYMEDSDTPLSRRNKPSFNRSQKPSLTLTQSSKPKSYRQVVL
eukprot:Phypoly_transcript_00335.p1 GENE.Phypoly_transcript_00335~~Phypoly_transcript_00335.p1  ORF type:complete len:1700 (+),score=200.84 Phypoly_transcript_00335:31-5130(+)